MVSTRSSTQVIMVSPKSSTLKGYYNEAMEFLEIDAKEEAVKRLFKLCSKQGMSPYLRAIVNIALAFHADPFENDLVEHATKALEMCTLIEKTEIVSKTLSEVLTDVRADAKNAMDLEETRRARYAAQKKNRKRVLANEEEDLLHMRKKIKAEMDNDENIWTDSKNAEVDVAFEQPFRDAEDQNRENHDQQEENADDDELGEDTDVEEPREIGHEIRAQSRGNEDRHAIPGSESYIAKLVDGRGNDLAVAMTGDTCLFTQAFMAYALENPTEMRKLIEGYERSKSLPSWEAKVLFGGEVNSMSGLSYRTKE